MLSHGPDMPKLQTSVLASEALCTSTVKLVCGLLACGSGDSQVLGKAVHLCKHVGTHLASEAQLAASPARAAWALPTLFTELVRAALGGVRASAASGNNGGGGGGGGGGSGSEETCLPAISELYFLVDEAAGDRQAMTVLGQEIVQGIASGAAAMWLLCGGGSDTSL